MAVATLRSWATLDELIELSVSSGRSHADAIDDIEALLRLHLLVVDDQPSGRLFRVRPLIRDALELAPSERQLADLDRHLVEFADMTLLEERSSGPIIWVRALARREADLEAALGRAIDRGDGNAAGVLADALASIWVRTGRLRDGERAFRRLRDATWRSPAPAGRAAITDAWTVLFRILSSTSQARRESLAREFDAIVDAAMASGDERSVSTVCELSVEAARRCHHYESVVRHCRIALDLAHDRGELRTAAAHGTWLAMALHVTGDLDAAARAGVEALTTARAAESATLAAYASMLLAQLPRDVVTGHGHAPTMAQAVELAELADDPYVLVDVLPAAAGAALVRGEVSEALAAVTAALDVVRRDALYEQGLPALLVLVAIAVIREDDEVAALLGGAVADQLPMLRGVIGARVVDLHLAGLQLARGRLGHHAFDARAARGAALAWREVYRTAGETAAAWIDQDDRERPGAGLTEREREVLQLLATGISNKQIARELGITAKTATHHTSSIYRKLGVSTRTEAVNTAFRHGLLRNG
jgi:DNA-binding CsgD family transcriptional regulator